MQKTLAALMATVGKPVAVDADATPAAHRANTVTDLEIDTGPTRTFAAGTTPRTVVVDNATRPAFDTNKGAASVSVINLGTGRVFAGNHGAGVVILNPTR